MQDVITAQIKVTVSSASGSTDTKGVNFSNLKSFFVNLRDKLPGDWSGNVEWKYYNKGDSIYLITLIPKYRIILPKWIEASSQPKECQEIYDKEIGYLEEHEKEHQQILDDLLTKLENELSKKSPRTSISDLEKIIEEYNVELDDKTKELDDTTDHGRKDRSYDLPETCK